MRSAVESERRSTPRKLQFEGTKYDLLKKLYLVKVVRNAVRNVPAKFSIIICKNVKVYREFFLRLAQTRFGSNSGHTTHFSAAYLKLIFYLVIFVIL